MIKYRIIIEKPTDASPETKEQFVSQALVISNQGEKDSLPSNSTTSFGLALPQKFFSIRFTNIKTLII